MLKLFPLLLFCVSTVVLGQGTTAKYEWSTEASDILKEIQDDSGVPSDTLGIRNVFLGPDFPLTRLRKNVAKEELVALTSHDNPIVRCYAFKALTMVSEPDAFAVLIKHLQDTVEVQVYAGCLGSEDYVGDFFMSTYSGREAITHDSAHLVRVDSLLLFTPNKLVARDAAARRAGDEKKYYERIRELAIHERFFGALLALAKFRKDRDAAIILNTKVNDKWNKNVSRTPAIIAVSGFVHPSFFPSLATAVDQLVANPGSEKPILLFRAIVAYGNTQSRDLLSRIFEIPDRKIRQANLEDLSRTLIVNSNPVYNDLRKRLGIKLIASAK